MRFRPWSTARRRSASPFRYNRPDLLSARLELVAEVERGTDRVEVWVTDDRSTRRSAIETARGFAERHQYIGFRLNPTNIGLERNLIEACHPCRGEFLLILGNDDMLHPGALDEMLADIDASRHDLMVYGKVRIDNEGEIIRTGSGRDPRRQRPGIYVNIPTYSASPVAPASSAATGSSRSSCSAVNSSWPSTPSPTRLTMYPKSGGY